MNKEMEKGSKKYEVYFCSCGRVHFVDSEKLSNAIVNEKEILVVCNNCGNSFIEGADKEEYDDEEGYMMYLRSMRDTEINDTSKIDSIVFTSGEKVRMMTGGEATFFGSGTFIDWETKKPDNISMEEWKTMRETVNVEHTINWIRDDNKLSHMSNYVTGIDWKGTKFEKVWS